VATLGIERNALPFRDLRNPSGVVAIKKIGLMTVIEQWLPIENAHEERLNSKMVQLAGKTVKGLRFNLSDSLPPGCPGHQASPPGPAFEGRLTTS
jgi:hypothetical protein